MEKLTDQKAINTLFASELTRMGTKTAADAPPQAFEDHKDFEATLENVMAEDKKNSWEPNDMLLD